MQTSRRERFTTIRNEGAILPSDLLQRMATGDSGIDGLKPSDYHLLAGERLNEAINRSWNRLLGAWETYQGARDRSPAGDTGTSLTRERWLLPLFPELGYGWLQIARALELDGKSCPVSHSWGHLHIHPMSWRMDLDRRTADVAGTARMSPHSLVQEVLDRNDGHLWDIVSNGLRLRILRDNASLTRQAHVEFDLEAMMQGEVYADFVLLWLLGHQSRVEDERPVDCWLERWSQQAQSEGTRALEGLRNGVEQAIERLGEGLLTHPANGALRERLRSGALDKQDFYRQLLRTVYRLLFLFVAEDRELLLIPDAPPEARERYQRYYSTARLRRLAERQRGTAHPDLWQGLRLVFGLLGRDDGCPELGLPALGSFLWSSEAAPDVDGCELANDDLLDAIRALAFVVSSWVRRVVDYCNLGSEELGSVYESLLEPHPVLNVDARVFRLDTASGHERKTTGSYYTPTSLITSLLDSALDPVLAEAASQPDPEPAILALKVCDPACGSGHFLIATAHRIAKRLAAVRTGDDEPSPEATRQALRDVVGSCIYSVDINPMAVDLCKVSLGLEALEPGKPPSFLDHRIQVGNSLLGVTPRLLAGGIPDEAFNPIQGDDKKYASQWKKLNQDQRTGQLSFDDRLAPAWERLGDFASALQALELESDATLAGVRRKQERWEAFVRVSGDEQGRLLADTWCAAFVWKKTPDFAYPITQNVLAAIRCHPHDIAPWMRDEIRRLAAQYHFFHWQLAFPDVFWVPGPNEEPDNELRTREELEARGWRLDGNVFVRGDERYLPLYEAKMIHQFDHRRATYNGLETRDITLTEKADPNSVTLPRYWVPEAEVHARLAGKWERDWLLGWREICRSTDEHTVIASVLPSAAVGNKIPLMILGVESRRSAPELAASLASFVYDYSSRQRIGGTTLNFFIYQQLPALAPDYYGNRAAWQMGETTLSWFQLRVVEFSYTAWDLHPFAKDCGYDGQPFRWGEERRFLLRCELVAAYFHRYGIERDDVDYIMATFPIVKKDEATHGEYRTKRVILEIYDELAEAIRTRVPYQTRLDPPPADPRMTHRAGIERSAASTAKVDR